MEKLKEAAEYAEYIIQKVKQNPGAFVNPDIPPGSKGKSIHQKLSDLYLEEKAKDTDDSGQLHASRLLGKLVKRDKLECLVLNLFAGNEGYSLMIKGRNGIEAETLKLPYEASEFLEYVDSSELPPFLVDLLERAQVNVFYSGSVILEVRDYRRANDGRYDTDYVLLKPTSQSLLADIYNLSSDGHRWTQDDLFTLESQLLLATEEPICLDPSPAVHLVANRLQYEKKVLDTPMIKRSVKKFTQAAINRKRKFEQAEAPKELRLYDFVHKKRVRSHPHVNLKHVDMWKQKLVQLSTPETVEVEKYATVMESPDNVADNDLDLVEEQMLERGTNQEKKLLAKLSILKRKSDHVYYGELYIDHDHKEGSHGSSCTFMLGSKGNVDKYLQQFKEIFTEEGRLAVKITKQIPGQPAVIEYTQTSSTSSGITNISASAVLGTHHPSSSAAGVEHAAAPGLLMAKRNVPIQLSLTLAPAGTNAQTGNQLQLNIQKQTVSTQSQMFSQRNKFSTAPSSQRSASNTPNQSPATTPTSATVQSQLFPHHLTNNSSKSHLFISSPPSMSTVTTATISKKSSHTTEVGNQGQVQSGTAGNIAFVQSGENSQGQTNQPQGLTSINFSGLPPNINIQNITGLSGINIANLQGLQNLQMSNIAVPVPISLVSSNAGVLQNQGGIFVSSIPGLVTVSSSAPTTLSQIKQASSVSSAAPSIVTFVTALPSSVSSSVVNTTSGSTAPTSTGMLSVSIASLAPLVSAGMRTQSGSGIRTNSLPLLQIQGQPGGLQLLGLQQQRAPLKPGTATLATQSAGQIHIGGKNATSIPSSGVLTAQTIGGHQVALSQLKPGQPQQAGGQIPQQLMLQQIQRQQFQLQPFQIKPPSTPVTSVGANLKPKSKKRTTPTPPKH
ncbi:transcription factor SPT20 homolog isoform X2 [Mytilus californianus]|uniref:transcription factor SPT20 homolog isoform X2 n=1 Tax=Mytilus californianus TaxID=6549 RepID=UPI0022483949|nr:transcription factor SPT20 homolog isoform X2 [Mytilus californianus]